MIFIPSSVIKKKRDGHELSQEEIQSFVSQYHLGQLPDYQMAALLMAITLKGLTKQEAAHLTLAMLNSGQTLTFENTKYQPVDKHSTGGIGDKTSLLIAPIVASCGVPVPMIAGRGLGHTGGTLDKLESIPGYNIFLPLSDFKKQVLNLGCAMIGQTQEICPADKKMYALRDVTGTVESIGLICGSILSKKIAEGVRGLVMDVKCGTGAFMKTKTEATELATWLAETALLSGVQTTAFITAMNQPLGRFVGNSLEVLECLSIFENKSVLGFSPDDFSDTRELSLVLSAEMLVLSGRCKNSQEAYALAQDQLSSGAAFRTFQKMVAAQSGRWSDFSFPENQNWRDITAPQSGFVDVFDAEKIGYAAISLGAGRKVFSDKIDFHASIIVHKKIGDPVKAGEKIFSFTSRLPEQNSAAEEFLKASLHISLQKVDKPDLILNKIGGQRGSY